MESIKLLVDSLNYIELHLKDNIKTADIAKACYCSKSTLEKLFGHVYSISIHEYIVRRRITLAARLLSERPETSILEAAVEYGYNSHEAFTRAFRKVFNCNPSEFRKRKHMELFPRYREPIRKGDSYMMQRRNVDISELYDLFCGRKNCYFVCCDIKELVPINDISRKAGDLAILETMRRMEEAAGEEDIIFRIGGDEFCMLTNSEDEDYAEGIVQKIKSHNGETFCYGEKGIPLHLWVVSAKPAIGTVRYNELFTGLHYAIKDGKNPEE